MDLEKRIRQVKRATFGLGTAAILSAILMFTYSAKENYALNTEVYKSHTNTKQIIANIEKNNPYLTENTYFAGDTLLKKFSEQQLELDNLTKAKFEKHLSKIEKDPEFIRQKENYSKSIRRGKYSVLSLVITMIGAIANAFRYGVLKKEKTALPL